MKFLLTFLFACACSCAYGATNAAASVEYADVKAAVDASTTGDVVTIPAGTATWTNTQSLVVTNNISILGAGIGQTFILYGWTSGSSRYLVNWAGQNITNISRISGISFDNNGGTSAGANGTLAFGGSCTNFRIDHCSFGNLPDDVLAFYAGAGGVVDHCYRTNITTSTRLAIFFNGIDTYGDAAWTNAAQFGKQNTIYIEDCVIHRPSTVYGTIDGWRGGRVVLRNSYLVNSRVGNHGTESSQRYRSGRSMEFYNNVFSNSVNPSQYFDNRGGAQLSFSNVIYGPAATAFKLNAYRVAGADPPWGAADGTKAWDAADLTDGAETPYGAGDGIFEVGTSDSGGLRVLGDSTKNWTTNQWQYYTLREVYTNTATSGGVRSAVVSGAGWTTNQWAGYEFTKTSDNSKGRVTSNTDDTLTLSTDYYAVNMTGGGEFVLSVGTYIVSNTSTQLTVAAAHDSSRTFPSSTHYQIRRVTFVLDQPGGGRTTAISGSPPNNQNLGQSSTEPVYGWGNKLNDSQANVSNGGYYSIQEDRDFFNQNASFDGSAGIGIGTKAQMEAITGTTTNVAFWVTDEGSWNTTTEGTDGQLYRWNGSDWELYYTPLAYPHPLAGEGGGGGGGGAAYTATAGNVTVQGNLILTQ